MKKFSTLTFVIQKFQKQLSSAERIVLSEKQSEPKFKAPEQSVKNVLDFAFAYHAEKSTSTGNIEFILN